MTMASAETFRAREVYRYYQPKDSNAIQNVADEALKHADDTAWNDTLAKNFTTQRSFSDTALTAFAQLIALRLSSQRAIVSLIDHQNEYFLAESTSTLSLIDNDGAANNAWLSISGASVPRNQSLCEQTLMLVPNQDTMAEKTPCYLVPDLQLDKKMRELDCVRGPPYLRFYCGVALTNTKGINIGCVYVVDDRPRTDFSLEQAQFLTKMAATVMDHLEGIRAKEDIVRVTMMSQALHAFIEGDGTMSGDWQRLKRYNLPSGAGVGFSWETNKNDGTGTYVDGKKQLGHSRFHTTLSRTNSDSSSSPQQSPLQHTGNTQDARYNFNNSPWSSTSEVAKVPPLKSVFEVAEESVAAAASLEVPQGGRDMEFSNDGFSTLLHTTFSRASNLAREGMEIDGAVFFDAPFRFYQGRSTLQIDPRRSDTTESVTMDSDSDDDRDSDDEEHPEHRPGPHPLVPQAAVKQSNHFQSSDSSSSQVVSVDSMGLKSDVLGFSTPTSSSLKGQAVDPATFSAIEQSLLTSLVRRYPQGQLFEFDEEGPITPEDIDAGGSNLTILDAVAEAKKARRRARKQGEILRLLLAFPGARHIAFVPLYDSTSGCFIGSFAWSTSSTRLFTTDNHLSYLIAFGHSVMSEVSRLNTLSADRAKGDFISNVSHELRSPLHGILASVEFLADTHLDGFQKGLVDTIDICGRTLLDTIEHVLDFSKIKRFGQESSQSMGVVSDLDISAVIEEVLEGVYAGFEFNGLSSQGLADNTRSGARNLPANGTFAPRDFSKHPEEQVTVIIDIDFKEQWKFPTAAGTLKRLAMNVFGNALKYTHRGYIKIKLEARPIVATLNSAKSAKERTMVTLTVSDSGQGMSSEFMKTKLFMPFSQEDATAPGTGLGMSIVKQIVDLSGGRIDVRSDQLTGTEIKLSLPLENCAPQREGSSATIIPATEIEGPVDAVRRRAAGRSINIQGFAAPPGTSELHVGSLASLRKSMVKYCSQWFHLNVLPSSEDTDISILDEVAFLSLPPAENRSRLLVVLCENSARRELYPTTTNSGQIVEFVSKPCGPHRLAKALLNCLDSQDTSPKMLPKRVSAPGSHNEGILSENGNATVTAGTGTSSVRLIGDLQSSIGYSPAIISLIKTPGLQTTSETHTARPVPHRGSGESGSTWSQSSKSSLSDKAQVVNTDEIFASPTSLQPTESNTTQLNPAAVDHILTSLRQPKMLLVEDNPVNMMLLATYMKKNKWEYEKATNGLLALQAFRERPEGFDVIFMDVSMPVMTGYESTRHIRTVETERRLAYEHQNLIQSPLLSPNATSFPFANFGFSSSSSELSIPTYPSNPACLSNSNSPSAFNPLALDLSVAAPRLKLNAPALIIALTGFSSQKDQELAFEAGMDIFMTKPVRFREIGKILDGWRHSRELEAREKGEKAANEVDGGKRELDEVMSGAKRSG